MHTSEHRDATTTTDETVKTQDVQPDEVSKGGIPVAAASEFKDDHTIANVRTSVTRSGESTERSPLEHDE